ncbi:hypothetical protein HOK68_01650 [Candidatus Woesearchaeota archaeon]|jgi:SAM-dependent methyltransferase|nr:hypothetical protein [Candidatus Woesearchaeota archaeon]MBT4595858.1 hypothetical protein [Candidatus Woesearchaeota archaeon]MBT5741293.1 hypothetical protein [Candidatus Woesearchaeota archaeon]MBT6505465.1 hypothetical protein [Candidatus Woesearchaeota archaeon]MBT7296153.1 hypothetical protein [Candidatus Woesearchaeota archaeon]
MELNKLVFSLNDKLSEQYECDNFDFTEMKLGILKILNHLPNYKGKKILDLGCGSVSSDFNTSYDNYISACDDDLISKYTFYPWICRGLFELGAHPIGIDYGSLTGEKFEHYDRVNLLLENSLSMIDDNSIDIVHTKLLYNSPQLEMMKGDTEKLKYILVPQIKRVLKTDGILLADWDKTI